ncbi:molybdenum ABC transporter ATP-binding protein [Marinomonas agarivorans]|nr:molybdenum ABC transporter ATP-binding protein [Marinomonas agarivorans]
MELLKMTDNSVINLTIKKQFNSLLLDYKLTVPNQGVTFIYGPSGAGKTSLINLIAGLLTPDEGSIVVEGNTFFDSKSGVNKKIHHRAVGYVFQDTRLFPHLTVEGNLFYSRSSRSNQQAEKLIALLDLKGLLNRKPNTLSGGEKQRVAIARALLSNPNVLLLDEPFAFLDQEKKQKLLHYFSKLVRYLDIPIIMVSHSKQEIFQLADHLVLLETGKVIGNGFVEQTWNTQIANQQDKGIIKDLIFPVRFLEAHEHYAMIKVELLSPFTFDATDCQLWINQNQISANQQDIHRVKVSTEGIQILLENQSVIEEHNVINCTFIKVLDSNEEGVVIALRVNNSDVMLYKHLTTWLWDKIQLQEQQSVKIQINQLVLIR